MDRRGLAIKLASVLSENDIRKSVPSQRTVFHISDDDGGKSDFVIKKDSRGVKYTVDDVYTILEALVEVIIDSIKHGEKISIAGFGILYLKRRAARWAPHPKTGETYEMKEHFVIKFDAGKNLKAAAAIYSANDREVNRKADSILSGDGLYADDEDEESMI